ncbi:MAG: GDP-L-fucose synthase [Gammaproteobacteria bacterium]|nr:GDP-L-fucose synthase [Gammaproteobacteria bacterium]
MNTSAKVFVAGARGMVGSAIVRALERHGYTHILTPSREQVDLKNQSALDAFYAAEKPDLVFVAAAKVGGILANSSFPADFLYDNLIMECNLIHGAYRHGVKKLLFLGSTCIYPKLAAQPLKEEYLLSGPLEPTNEWYAVAKIAGIKLCEAYRRQFGANFISGMPTNLYGPNDNFDLSSSHVLPALIRKFDSALRQDADEVVVWGSGTPLREFLHVDDCADACLYLMDHYDEAEHVNIGVGEDLTIRELAELVGRVVGFVGRIVFDPSKPDGTPRKLVDTTRINSLGWRPRIALEEGIRSTYAWYLANVPRHDD